MAAATKLTSSTTSGFYRSLNSTGLSYGIPFSAVVLALQANALIIQIYRGRSGRTAHTCHKVGSRQMITVGGLLYPNLTSCDWESKGVAIYDLSTLNWGSVYSANAGAYQVPAPVVQSIGGTANGSAAMMRPRDDYATEELAALFNATLLNPPSAGKLRGGAIAGVAVGATVAGLLLVALTAFLVRRRYRRRQHCRNCAHGPPPVEADGDDVLETDGHVAAKEAQAARGPFAEMDVNPPRFADATGPPPGAAAEAGPLDEKRTFSYRAELGPEAQVVELPAGWLSRSSLAQDSGEGSGATSSGEEASLEEGESSRGASPEAVSSPDGESNPDAPVSPGGAVSPEGVSSPEAVSSPTAAGNPMEEGEDAVSELGEDERSYRPGDDGTFIRQSR